MKKVVQKIVLAGIVVDNGKALIVHRSKDDDSFPDFWEVPGGKRDLFEKTPDGLKREVKEETGLDIEVGDPVGVFEFKAENKEEIRDSTQISFLVKPVGEIKVKLSSEHQNFAWVTKEELDNYNLSEETKGAIRKALSI